MVCAVASIETCCNLQRLINTDVPGHSSAYSREYQRRFVTFDGIAKACAKAAGMDEPELVHYNPKDFDFGKKKVLPPLDKAYAAHPPCFRAGQVCSACRCQRGAHVAPRISYLDQGHAQLTDGVCTQAFPLRDQHFFASILKVRCSALLQ